MVVSKRKRGCRARCQARHMLGETCLEATPTPEDSGVSFIEQSGTPGESSSCRTRVFCPDLPLWKISAELLSSCAGGWWGEFFDGMDHSLDSDSGSGSESSAR